MTMKSDEEFWDELMEVLFVSDGAPEGSEISLDEITKEEE